MESTVGQMKVGTRLVFGKYGVRNEDPQPIVWIKATPNCDFISRDVLDWLQFDDRESRASTRDAEYNGNSRFSISNICSFLNSDERKWYHGAHAEDSPPRGRGFGGSPNYESHYGFLHYFDEHEINSIQRVACKVGDDEFDTLIRLPSQADIFGEQCFNIFHRAGIRARATPDMLNWRNHSFGLQSYVQYWLMDRIVDRTAESSCVKIVSRDANCNASIACNACGVRPVCRIRPDITVEKDEYERFTIKPYAVPQNTCTDAELMDFLGITHP